MRLNQVNALVTGQKGEAEKVVGEFYKVLQKPDLFEGMERTYKPLDEETGEKLPAESQKVQFRVNQLMENSSKKWAEMWDLVFTQDVGNQSARADIVVDGRVVVPQVPVTSLLFLEKQINDVETFLSKLPTPDPAEDWVQDENTDLLKTKQTLSNRTKKIPRNHVKAEATQHHPAQVEVYSEDVHVGSWQKIRYSGSIPAKSKNNLLEKARKLKNAVKLAREEANMLDVKLVKIGEPIFKFLLEDIQAIA